MIKNRDEEDMFDCLSPLLLNDLETTTSCKTSTAEFIRCYSHKTIPFTLTKDLQSVLTLNYLERFNPDGNESTGITFSGKMCYVCDQKTQSQADAKNRSTKIILLNKVLDATSEFHM